MSKKTRQDKARTRQYLKWYTEELSRLRKENAEMKTAVKDIQLLVDAILGEAAVKFGNGEITLPHVRPGYYAVTTEKTDGGYKITAKKRD